MEENRRLQWALWYFEKMNFSIIPIIPGDKKPLVPWQVYQKERASREQIVSWWSEHPTANVGIVTGAISDLGVIDIDNDEGRKNLEAYIPESFVCPVANTPRGGQHYYCRIAEGLANKVGIISGTDFRGEGGYIVAPPSQNGNGKKYRWDKNLGIGKTPMPPLPNDYLVALKDISFRGDCKGGDKNPKKQFQQFQQFLQKGTRDNDLFHAMNCLAKGGYERELAEKVAEIIAEKCDPPFSKKEAAEKVLSAYERRGRSERNITQELREYINQQETNINLTEAYETLQFQQGNEKAACQIAMTRFCKEGLLEKVSRGTFKKIEKDCPDIDIWSGDIVPLDIKYPLGIHELIITHPKNIIIIAGEANAGKTAFALNFAQMNCGREYEVIYFSSEMGAIELQARLRKFNMPLDEWKNVIWKERSADFSQMIRPNAINIIDFLEVHDDFYKVGLFIKQIFDKLDKGIAFIALQKNKGRDEGLGGGRSLEKARLYLAMEPGRLKIVKAKNWRNDAINPNGLIRTYRLGGGCHFKTTGDWEK